MIRVAELFAGVGGFKLGLQQANIGYDIVWSNQWEPLTKMQHASMVYKAKFGSANHSNENIELVSTSDIPDHDLLVGGFPCQDYSVATTLKNAKGLIGKKGILWWSIYRILKEKGASKPKYLLFENVDRLLKSPAQQRGRDFAIILKCLDELGYAVEWRVVNAAEYGMPQRRRRVFIIAYQQSTNSYNQMNQDNHLQWILNDGVFPQSFPVQNELGCDNILLEQDILSISEGFNKTGKQSPFQNAGVMQAGVISTVKVKPDSALDYFELRNILEEDADVHNSFYIDIEDLNRWKYLKGSKKEKRITKAGFRYNYSEGSMVFPDDLTKPSRTIITGEGGKSPSRFKHVVETARGLRRLTPIELERLNMFPDNHTQLEGIADAKRAFFMGNALVVGVVQRIGEVLFERIEE